MKRIKIECTDKFADAVTKEIKAVEGRATARTISATTIYDLVGNVERRLGIPKAHLDGVRIEYTGAEKFPSAYKYTPESTHFAVERHGAAWYVVDISRKECPNRINNVTVILTDEAKQAVIDKYTSMHL